MKIVVLAGGLSPERDVSLSSGCLIANALMESNHSVILLDLYKGLDIELLESKTLFKNEHDNIKYHHLVNESEPDLNKLKEDTNNEDNLIGINVINICKKADIIFMALHGSSGENGQIQALFDVLGIKYTGTGYVGSLLAMDKDITKKLLLTSNILTPKWFTINNNEELEKAINKISLPCIMKPIDNGSSIGVSIIENLSDAKKKFLETKKSNSKIMIEEKISGREFSVGILENQALPIIEIIPNKGFYDYKNKYQSGFTKEICPAFISEDKRKQLQNLAIKIHEILRLGSYSRIDFIMDSEDNFYCLEANTLPGMTPTSLLPQEAQEFGISYIELCNRIVQAK